ncbi:MAG: HlyD family efflux transporter periplasmic adaptor subunit [Undibacterium sp.]|nr:HlyD family efflux transporter periplasmic adaptor subunit [Undibacterium sp.]
MTQIKMITLLTLSLLSSLPSLAQVKVDTTKVQNKPIQQNPYKRPVIFTGEVQALDSQRIIVPESEDGRVTLRYFAPEGTKVKVGDVVLRIENKGGAEVERLDLEIVQNRERGMRELADLEVRSIEAERALFFAQANLLKAKIDAVLPKEQLAALVFDQYQGTLDAAVRDLDVKQKAFDNAKASIARKEQDNELAARKLQIQLGYVKLQQEKAEFKAERSGVVIHGYDPWTGTRVDEGGSANSGMAAGQILGDGRLAIKAWVLEVDRPFLKEGQAVEVHFDAIPDSRITASITRISSAPEKKASWGNGRYFQVEIALPEQHGLVLAQGMSAAISPIELSVNGATAKTVAATKKAASITPKEINLEGEILSRVSTPVVPPTIPQVWGYKLVKFPPEGSQIKAGQMVAVFEVNELAARLETSHSMFNEKQKTLEKLILDHAESARLADLAVSEAKSNAEKAVRKASVPRELVKRIEYDKLVIERDLSTKIAELSLRQKEAQQRARTAELRGLKSELAQLKTNIDALEKGKRDLIVKAPRAGTLIHAKGHGGEKIAVGSRLYMGMAAGSLADPEKIYVTAKVAEAQIGLLKIGQLARVTLSGANTVLAAKVSAMGPVFHGKSESEAITVRDIELEFDTIPKNLKPGSAVQVFITPSSASVAFSSANMTTKLAATKTVTEARQ